MKDGLEKAASQWTLGKISSLHFHFFKFPRSWRLFSPFHRFTKKMVLKRPFVGDTGQDSV